MMSTLNRLQIRLFSAMLVFYAMVLTFGPQWRDCMVAAALFVMLCIPARLLVAGIEIADSMTGSKLLGTRP